MICFQDCFDMYMFFVNPNHNVICWTGPLDRSVREAGEESRAFADQGMENDGDVDLFAPTSSSTQQNVPRSASRSRSHVSVAEEGSGGMSSLCDFESFEQSRNEAVVRGFLDNPPKLPKSSLKEDIRQMKSHVRRSTLRDLDVS